MLISALIVLAICHLIAAIGFHHNTHTPLHCVAFSHSPIFCLTLSSNSFRSTPLQFNYIYKYNCLLLHFISSVFINLFTKRVFGFVAILRVCVRQKSMVPLVCAADELYLFIYFAIENAIEYFIGIEMVGLWRYLSPSIVARWSVLVTWPFHFCVSQRKIADNENGHFSNLYKNMNTTSPIRSPTKNVSQSISISNVFSSSASTSSARSDRGRCKLYKLCCQLEGTLFLHTSCASWIRNEQIRTANNISEFIRDGK